VRVFAEQEEVVKKVGCKREPFVITEKQYVPS